MAYHYEVISRKTTSWVRIQGDCAILTLVFHKTLRHNWQLPLHYGRHTLPLGDLEEENQQSLYQRRLSIPPETASQLKTIEIALFTMADILTTIKWSWGRKPTEFIYVLFNYVLPVDNFNYLRALKYWLLLVTYFSIGNLEEDIFKKIAPFWLECSTDSRLLQLTASIT